MKLKVQSLSYTLSLLPWDVFGTLTFDGKAPPVGRCWSCAWSHFHAAAKLLDTPYGRLAIALRSELGESEAKRFHFHYLLKVARAVNNVSVAHVLEAEWRSRVGAIVEVRPYDPGLAGAGYVVKCLSDNKTEGANEYERRKFDKADEVELSDEVFRRVRGLRSTKDTVLGVAAPGLARPAQCVKRGDDESPTLAQVALTGVKDGSSPQVVGSAAELFAVLTA